MSAVAGVKQRFGRYGVWVRANEVTDSFTAATEALGFRAVWVGGSPAGDLELIERLLGATERLVIATGIVSIWTTDPETLAASYHRVDDRFPGRFVLGIGVGHREREGEKAVAPFGAMEAFLDGLDDHRVPVEGRLLAALGPRMLVLSAERTLGAHPYMTTPTHTATARAQIGPDPFLAPEQRVVITSDHEAGMAEARRNVVRYLGITNYRNNLLAMGYQPSELEGEGSDGVIADLAAVGDVATAVARLEDHHDAGADHVAIQVYAESDAERLAALGDLARRLDI